VNVTSRQGAVEKAKEMLKREGFADKEIFGEFWFKEYRVDAVGWSPRRKVAVECGYCTPRKKEDLEQFFDEVICLPKDAQAKPVSEKPPTRNVLAQTRLVLLKDDQVVFDVPLSRGQLPKERLEDEISAMGQNLQRFSQLFNAFSHQNRLRMMKLMMEDEDATVGFADFIHSLDLNPKLVWENTRKLSEGGLLEKSENGRYRCSEFGEASFIMLSAVLGQLQHLFESEGR
jgi:hypothetical protein